MEMNYKKRLVSLDPREYEHPLDREALNKLESIPGVKPLFQKIYKEIYEKLDYIQNSGSNLLLTKDNAPRVTKILDQSAKVLDINLIPPIYVAGLDMQGGYTLNGWTSGAYEPHIVLTKRALDELDDSELLALIGHELGHIKSGHVLYRSISDTLMSTLIEVISSFTLGLGSLPAQSIQIALLQWYRMSEFTADRAGLLACQDINAYLRLVLKLAGLPNDANIASFEKSFIKQATEFKEFDLQNVNKFMKFISTAFNTHPFSVLRASQLIDWEKSDEYKNILTREKLNIATEISSNFEFCPNCGMNLYKGDKFCSGCGAEITGQ